MLRENSALAQQHFYVDPHGRAATQAAQWQADGHSQQAALLRKIADRPVADWVTDGPIPVAERVGALVGRAEAAGQLPVLVAYNIPDRDCGGHSSGGAASAARYGEWIRGFARGIGNRPAVVILEPDAIAHSLQGCAESGERLAVLHDAVTVLKGNSSTSVYLDAGNPGWITDTRQLALALRRAGIAEADGFALNVANFYTTSDNITFGNGLSDALGGHIHFVVDTSRNGDGPAPSDDTSRWCNPPGRALGAAPTTETGQPLVDAFLWVKRPGESDGSCRSGEPPAGQWWPEYALGLAARAS
ncbi:endoglucanase [Actinoplanes sp. SE50]|nr:MULTISPECIES: glycoside hydrolase family 6 protein [unclassified Actinoplanes]AEV84146.1 putative secreted endoglucanase [Actinoplanes sp. SE50/110]ATO82538.1 endoglucanase [Actinoplanes sp. SE50]SLL99945.1 endoglucanase [Actinoplanes sp. SE50/110]